MISSSRTSHRASTKACTDVSLFCISKITTKSCSKYFGANRKDVINLTTKQQKKEQRGILYLFFASCHAKRDSHKVTHTKKRSLVKSRGGYFFFRE